MSLGVLLAIGSPAPVVAGGDSRTVLVGGFSEDGQQVLACDVGQLPLRCRCSVFNLDTGRLVKRVIASDSPDVFSSCVRRARLRHFGKRQDPNGKAATPVSPDGRYEIAATPPPFALVVLRDRVRRVTLPLVAPQIGANSSDETRLPVETHDRCVVRGLDAIAPICVQWPVWSQSHVIFVVRIRDPYLRDPIDHIYRIPLPEVTDRTVARIAQTHASLARLGCGMVEAATAPYSVGKHPAASRSCLSLMSRPENAWLLPWSVPAWAPDGHGHRSAHRAPILALQRKWIISPGGFALLARASGVSDATTYHAAVKTWAEAATWSDFALFSRFRFLWEARQERATHARIKGVREAMKDRARTLLAEGNRAAGGALVRAIRADETLLAALKTLQVEIPSSPP